MEVLEDGCGKTLQHWLCSSCQELFGKAARLWGWKTLFHGSKVGVLQIFRGCQHAGAGFVLQLSAAGVSGWQDEGLEPSPAQEPFPHCGHLRIPAQLQLFPLQGTEQIPGGWFSFSPQKCYSELRWLCVGLGFMIFLFCLFKTQGSPPSQINSIFLRLGELRLVGTSCTWHCFEYHEVKKHIKWRFMNYFKDLQGEKKSGERKFLDGTLWLDSTFNLCDFSHGLIFLYKLKL